MKVRHQSWVKKLGQWHLYSIGHSQTFCGRPMLGNNYNRIINPSDRTICSECWDSIKIEEVDN